MPNLMRSADELTADTLCEMRCARVAELLVDGEPYCIECADALIAGELPLSVLYRIEEAKMRPLPAPRYVPRPGDDEKLLAMGKAWEASPWNTGRAGRPPADVEVEPVSLQVTPDEPHEPEGVEPAGQLSFASPSSVSAATGEPSGENQPSQPARQLAEYAP